MARAAGCYSGLLRDDEAGLMVQMLDGKTFSIFFEKVGFVVTPEIIVKNFQPYEIKLGLYQVAAESMRTPLRIRLFKSRNRD